MYNKLSPEEESVIARKATEPPFTGEYDAHFKDGTYVCRRCNQPIFTSEAKFHANCGWPSFDDHFPGSVKRDAHYDPIFGAEITCSNCGGHLGHVYDGEKFTPKDTRHCANSLSIRFIPKSQQLPEILHP